MKTLVSALVLLLSAAVAFGGAPDKKHDGVSISFDSDDPRVQLGVRHEARQARVVVGTRNGAAVLMLLDQVVAVQLSDSALAAVRPDKDANFLEEWVAAGVRLAVKKAVEYPVAHIRSAEVRDGVLLLTNDEGKPVFADIKVNGSIVTRDLAPADAARFVDAFAILKGRH
ncbi:MAG: hypothetical protein JWN02_1481 [Acidobacteria bacterium]|nr:hypothetical protein [Acidobacteriota bacterium]